MSDPVIELVKWDGPWSESDPDSNFKADVALYSKLDPLVTIEALSKTPAFRSEHLSATSLVVGPLQEPSP
jgi:hypothetical protein